jgi:hypothetical protein
MPSFAQFNMLLLNNPKLDSDELANAVRGIAANRRRSNILFTGLQADVAFPTEEIQMVDQMSPMPQTPEQNLQTSDSMANGIHWRQRIRGIPVLGAFLAWAYALINLDRIRLDVLELQREHMELGRRISRLEAQGIDMQNLSNRLNRLDALDISNRLNVFDGINIANRLSSFDMLNIDRRLAEIEAQFDMKSGSEENHEIVIDSNDAEKGRFNLEPGGANTGDMEE